MVRAGLSPLAFCSGPQGTTVRKSLAEAAGNDVAALPFARIPGEVRQVRLPADTHFILPE